MLYLELLCATMFLDTFWMWLMGTWYSEQLREVDITPTDSPLSLWALGFYLVWPLAIYFFVLQPLLDWKNTLMRSLVLGWSVHASYNFTNLTTLQGWPRNIAMITMLWGVTSTATISLLFRSCRMIPFRSG